jgi:hypothetical protein
LVERNKRGAGLEAAKEAVMAALKGEERKWLLLTPTGAACSKLICTPPEIIAGDRHAWLHNECWEPWRAGQRAKVIAELLEAGVTARELTKEMTR